MTRPTLIIGATGTIGRQVVAHLDAAGAPVRAMTRNPEAARLPRNIEVVQGDLTTPDTLDVCLDGVDSVFLVWTAPIAAVDDAIQRIAARARRIVFLSAPLKTPHPFFQQSNPARTLGMRIEERIEASGMEWTFLRPGMFAANARHFWGPQIRAGDLVRWPYLAVATQPTDERDIAAVAVRALTEEGHAGAEYIIAGPESLTQCDQVQTIGRVIGRDLRIEEVTREEAKRTCLAYLPGPVADMLLDAWAAGLGRPAYLMSTFQELTGTPPRTFAQWVVDNASIFTT
jgi:uncharacterized protein YbjT (DUF2867 family)